MTSLIVSLQAPIEVFLGPLTPGDLGLRGTKVADCAAPWPSVPDLLIDPQVKTLIGVSYQVPALYRGMVQRLAAGLSSDVVRYDRQSAIAGVPPYQDFKGHDIHHLEIVWSRSDQTSFMLAQLCEDVWYFNSQRASLEDERMLPVAFGLNDVDDVLLTYGLRLPDSFSFPRLRISSARSEVPRRS
jgi:hypothetical protein